MCSRFRGSCPSDVKSAGHPESGFPIPLSGDAAALCAPREIQKNPVTRSRPRIPPAVPRRKQRTYKGSRKNTKSVRQLPRFRDSVPDPGFSIPLSGCQRKPSALPGRHQRTRPPGWSADTALPRVPDLKQRAYPNPRMELFRGKLIQGQNSFRVSIPL
ncbi:Uncharacterised protein [uncultured Clostridium sp.]|nr:Uncharacterised protein [uncultured Clostridium sp.]